MGYYSFRRRRFLRLLLVAVFAWCCGLVYIYSYIDVSISLYVVSLFRSPLQSDKLKQLMAANELPENSHNRLDPLGQFILQDKQALHFYHLPKRKTYSYAEITTANLDTSYPLAPDFTFHIRYAHDRVVIYEDSGPGCVYRIYLFPVLPTNADQLHRMTTEDLAEMYLLVDVDKRSFKFSLQQLMEGNQWPFLYPLSTRHSRPASGIGAYTPICYQESITISYLHSGAFPDNLWQINVNCTLHDLPCPVHVYSAVSRHRFPRDVTVLSFATSAIGQENNQYITSLKNAASLLSSPECNGPDVGLGCKLQCVEMCPRCKQHILVKNSPGVVSSIKIRVFETATRKMVEDWNAMTLVGYFDGHSSPQVMVPLGNLVGASGALNSFIGAAAGLRNKSCSYEETYLRLPRIAPTGYIYYPMPFWRKADIYVEGNEFLSTSYMLCSQVTTVPNYYNADTTAYFHAKRTYYTDQVDGYRDILKLEASWGHIVGLYMNVDNLKAIRNLGVSERWAALQADFMLFTDGSMSASALGTGLEDYFSYAHGFLFAENTTYSFVGVYYSAPRQTEPLTWYCYRQHILDPIPFQHSVHFYSEGTSQEKYHIPVTPISFSSHKKRLIANMPSLSHTVLYYARQSQVHTLEDAIMLGNKRSESLHHFRVIKSPHHEPVTFYLGPKHYLGASFTNATKALSGRAFSDGDEYEFKLSVSSPNKGLVLRREFYSPVGLWNERAEVFVNGESLGYWVIPMGSLNEKYSLRQDDFILSKESVKSLSTLIIEVHPRTVWQDLSYEILVLH